MVDPSGASEGDPATRRERLRAGTEREIRQTARRVLVDQGVDGLALRAVAREMGMTAPALYRYFTSREDLVDHVVADLYEELCDVLDAVRDATTPATPGAQLVAVSRAFREWATTHHAEFGLLFGSAGERVLGVEGRAAGERASEAAAQRFGGIFAAMVARLYLERGFPVPADDDIDPELQTQLRTWCEKLPVALPLGVMAVFLSAWIRLYGLVCMEVFGHLRFALDDAAPMFEAELRSLAVLFGVPDDYRHPERE